SHYAAFFFPDINTIVVYVIYFRRFHHTSFSVFFSHATPPTEIYTLSLHDALPISWCRSWGSQSSSMFSTGGRSSPRSPLIMLRKDRKSTRLNSSHVKISYAVFCLKKKKTNTKLEKIK